MLATKRRENARTSKPSSEVDRTRDVGRRKLEPDLTTYAGRVAARLRSLREENGWTVDDVIDRLKQRRVKITATALYRYENGYRVLPPNFYPDLAAVFRLPIGEFLPPK